MNNKISFKVQTFDKMKSNIRQEISLGLAFFIYFQTGLLLQYMSISQYCLFRLADKAENSNLKPGFIHISSNLSHFLCHISL